MKVKVWNTIQQLSKERGVDTSVIVSAIEESLKVASHQYFSHNETVKTDFNPKKGDLRVYSVKQVKISPQDQACEISLEEALKIDKNAALDRSIEIDLPYDTLGRIAAQAAKHVIFQKVRDAEQEKIFKLFAPRMGEIVTGVLRRIEANNNMILEINKVEVLFPEREMLPQDRFIRGDRIKATVIQVMREAKGAQVVVSRTDSRFLARLLELETPEISNGNIVIKNMVRQPGDRSKVAVMSKESDIDPIGACIGIKGNRILAISKELGGEKIDIVEWTDNPIAYAKSALSPAKVDDVFYVDKTYKVLQARVPQDQLSLAIGKKGINVRLASRLVGWKIEIKDR
ncbi:MAG: transcription termination factor NusA [Candidatus Aminicenantes bacterium]|nr:transcription termination factor NusA [Candidatus Aminicenantes bacterium]